MMAHEVSTPIQINENNPSFQNSLKKPSRQSKKKQYEGIPDQIRFLPSGAPVDFGNGSNRSKNNNSPKKQLKEPIKLSSLPSLPNGEKPQFHSDNRSESRRKKDGDQSSSKNKSKKSQRADNKAPVEISLPNGEKPNFNTNNNNNQKSKKNKKDKGPVSAVVEEDSSNYAGSSFHSSPAALNLPKPNFKPSPKQGVVLKEDVELVSPKLTDALSPASAKATAVASHSPQSPATTVSNSSTGYPPSHANPPTFTAAPYPSQQPMYPPQISQGALPPHFVPQPVPPPPLPPNQFYNPYLAAPPQMHYPQPVHSQPNQQGQKITFNQLLSSSK